MKRKEERNKKYKNSLFFFFSFFFFFKVAQADITADIDAINFIFIFFTGTVAVET
jgi:hypothetical protein